MSKTQIKVIGKTDIGNRRLTNQDNVLYLEEKKSPLNGYAMIAVADGMGGHAGGEVASDLALTYLLDLIEEYSNDSKDSDVLANVKKAVEETNLIVNKKGRSESSLRGMGTTLTAAWVNDKKLIVANVGDSRGYLISENHIKQITTDHSWVEEQVLAGVLTKEQAKTHPRRNIITRSIGTSIGVEVDIFQEKPKPGDVVLLCSDGLYPMVSDEEILSIVRNNSLDDACEYLIDIANARGGPDNIAVSMAEIVGTKNKSKNKNGKNSILDQDKTIIAKTKHNWLKVLIKKILLLK